MPEEQSEIYRTAAGNPPYEHKEESDGETRSLGELQKMNGRNLLFLIRLICKNKT